MQRRRVYDEYSETSSAEDPSEVVVIGKNLFTKGESKPSLDSKDL